MVRRLIVAAAAAALGACASPEASRIRGGGPGADPGNRAAMVRMHEGSRPYHGTRRIIAEPGPPLEPAGQARAFEYGRP